MPNRPRFISIPFAVMLGCGGASMSGPAPLPASAPATAPASAPASQPLPAPPGARLGTSATPRRYRVEMTIIPERETLSGVVDIDIDLAAATPVVWMNAADLTVRSARLASGQIAHVVPGGDEVIGFAFAEPVGPGMVQLQVEYDGKVSNIETQGVFRQQVGDDWYTFSQFESVSARAAFPCFDEPAFKTPWQLTLHIPKDDIAVANTMPTRENESGSMKTVVFAETRPIPAYLVAFGVGPFAIVDAGKSKGGVPVRLIVPRGKADEVRWAAQPTVEILSLTEDYFGIPYPFAKLDQLVIPKTVGFGAMENVGLITYESRLLIGTPSAHDIRRAYEYAIVAAHEIAHQWFGDLVTMDWWTETWLNESFASWMESKTYSAWRPGSGEDLERVATRSRALELDQLTSSRPIRQPVASGKDADDAFDLLTYDKGEAILEMFETWIGPEVFRRGVHRYLEAHAFGNASAADFFAMLSAEAGRDVAPVFTSFLDQSNAPLVTVELACAAGKPPGLHVKQEHFLPWGAAPDGRTWQIPICVRWGGGVAASRTCTVLTTTEADLPLTGATACPAWVFANAGGAGYYRTAYTTASLAALVERAGKDLSPAERIALFGDVGALIAVGKLPAGPALASLLPLTTDPERHVTSAAIQLFNALGKFLVPDDVRPRWAALIEKTYGPRARRLGVAPRPGDSDDVRSLRAELVRFVGVHGEDAQLQAEAKKLTDAWLTDHAALDRDTALLALELAAHHGDRALYDRIRAAVDHEKDLTQRVVLLHALGAFRDPALERETLALLLRPGFDIREAGAIFGIRGVDQEIRAIGWDFVKAHYDELSTLMPRAMRGNLVSAGTGLCDAAQLADYQAFFKDRAAKVDGGPRTYAATLEQIRACATLRQQQQPTIRALLVR